jgi:hypothetical protein
MLAAALPVARSLGVDPALLTCDEDNTASRKVIEANGGVVEDNGGVVEDKRDGKPPLLGTNVVRYAWQPCPSQWGNPGEPPMGCVCPGPVYGIGVSQAPPVQRAASTFVQAGP